MTDKNTPPHHQAAADGQRRPIPLRGLLREAGRILRLHQTLGMEEYPASPDLARFLAGSERTSPADPVRQTEAPPPSLSPASGEATLDDLVEDIRSCRRCSRHLDRRAPLAGTGGTGRNLLIIADAPSAEDDRTGLPFSDEAGKLLDRMLAAINMDRDAVSLTFLCKCHATAAPDQESASACLPFLLRQISALAPAVICAMGTKTAQILLHSSKSLSHLRGKAHDCKGIPLVATYHPDFLLKNEEMKKAAWVDLQLIQKLCQAGNRKSS